MEAFQKHRFARLTVRLSCHSGTLLLIISTAGLTYCAVGALSLLNHVPTDLKIDRSIPTIDGVAYEDLIRWLVARQTNYVEDEDDDSESQDDSSKDSASSFEAPQQTINSSSQPPDTLTADVPQDVGYGPLSEPGSKDLKWLGFNGRPNKVADTCYCFWNTGALAASLPWPFDLEQGTNDLDARPLASRRPPRSVQLPPRQDSAHCWRLRKGPGRTSW